MPYCPKCGAEAAEGTRFCPSCGQDLSAATIAAPQAARIPEQVKQRPTGVAIMAVLQVLAGLVFSGLGALMLVFAGFVGIAGLIPDIGADAGSEVPHSAGAVIW